MMRTRTVLAFLIAPISLGLVLLLVWSPGSLGILSLGMSALIGYPLALVVGMPAYFVMRRMGANGLISYCFMALIFAAILIFALIVYPVYVENDGDLSTLLLQARISQIAFLTFSSFFTLLIFWLIARPDKQV
jgi:hypothetical protein